MSPFSDLLSKNIRFSPSRQKIKTIIPQNLRIVAINLYIRDFRKAVNGKGISETKLVFNSSQNSCLLMDGA